MRRSAKFLIGTAIATLGFVSLANSASAMLIDIGITGSGTISVTSVPAADLATATVVSEPSWTVSTSTPVVTNFALSNPITLSVGSTIVVSFDIGAGVYSDTLKITTDAVSGHTVSVTAVGLLTGPSAATSPTELDITFNQAGGTGHTITGSATYTASTVPEPATWAMMMLGFIGLGYAAFRRNAKAGAASVAI